MSGRIIIVLAVTCISMVSAEQSNSGDLLERSRREVPPTQWKELTKCCKGAPMIIKSASRTGCFPVMNGTRPMAAGNWSCWSECAYRNQKLVTLSNTLDNTAIAARIAELVSAKPVWSSVLTAAYATCTESPPTIPASQVCRSGASNLNHCMVKYLYTHCPTGVKNPSDDCTNRLNSIK